MKVRVWAMESRTLGYAKSELDGLGTFYPRTAVVTLAVALRTVVPRAVVTTVVVTTVVVTTTVALSRTKGNLFPS
jgi:hypothetical protein